MAYPTVADVLCPRCSAPGGVSCRDFRWPERKPWWAWFLRRHHKARYKRWWYLYGGEL